jgi:flavodoxin
MNAIIILFSYHHNNTEKIAKVISNTLGAEIKKQNQIDPNGLVNYDFVGFGSGVYMGKLHKDLLEFADKIPQVNNKKAFIFSTSGRIGNMEKFHKELKEKLQSKGFDIVNEFNSAGFDTFGPLKIVGGINKGRPNEDDLKKAEAFAQGLKKDSSETSK